MQQHKLEIKGKTFREDILLQKMVETLMICFFTGININRVWKDDKTWFGCMQQRMLVLLNGVNT
jgi:hypothetical protein